MQAVPFFKDKRRFSDGAIIEIVLWTLPDTDAERPHGLKYRLYYRKAGQRLVSYDNERGDTTPYYGIGFEDMTTMLSTLTPKRWELIQSLRRGGPLTVYALAKALSRDYKNVHTDVAALEAIDLIERTEDGKVCVPWDEIEAHIRLAA